jgi:transketolase
MSSSGPTVTRQISLEERALRVRRTVLEMCRRRGQGYAGQGLALADLLTCLFFEVMRRDGDGRMRDRFVLSTGHSAIGLFAVLGELGVYDREELAEYGTDGSRIEESPLEGTPGFEITGGSLGQGLSQAVGIALGERLLGADTRVFCLLSDGELQEGQVWEAAMSAAHHRLGSLTVLVDNNGIQADGATAEVMGVEPVLAKFESFGFDAALVDPHDVDALLAALRASSERPRALVLATIPGRGVPSFETNLKVHYIRADDEVWKAAIEELTATAHQASA